MRKHEHYCWAAGVWTALLTVTLSTPGWGGAIRNPYDTSEEVIKPPAVSQNCSLAQSASTFIPHNVFVVLANGNNVERRVAPTIAAHET